MPADPTTLAAFFEAWELFRAPALAGTLAGLLLGVIGVYVVLRRMVFLSAAISQAAGLGVAAAFFVQLRLGIEEPGLLPALGAALATLLAVYLVMRPGAAAPRRDALLGLAWLLGAAGTLVLGSYIVQELTDIDTLLFGSAVAVLPEDFTLLAVTTGLLLALHLWWWRGFAAVSFDPAGARVRRLPVALLETVLFLTLGLAVSVCTRVMGALPTFAFSVLPAMAALRLAPNVQWALWLAGALGAACGFGGYLAAFTQELPVGPAQTLVAVLAVAVLALIGSAWRSLRSRPATAA